MELVSREAIMAMKGLRRIVRSVRELGRGIAGIPDPQIQQRPIGIGLALGGGVLEVRARLHRVRVEHLGRRHPQAQQDVDPTNQRHEPVSKVLTDAEDAEIITPDGFGDKAEGAMTDKAHNRSDAQGIMYTLSGRIRGLAGEILHSETLWTLRAAGRWRNNANFVK